MSKARSQLSNIIDSGRSIALDCYAIGKTIGDKDPVGRLFKTDVMNKTVVFKRFQGNAKKPDELVKIDTTVYFPYDFDKVYDGGESVNLGDESFQKTLAFKISNGAASKEMMRRIAHDLKVLHLLESLHSLDPFIFRSKAEQTGMDGVIHPAYFAISADEWQAIREPIREKISRLVGRALGGAQSNAQDKQIERFLVKSGKPGISTASNPSSKRCKSTPIVRPKYSSPGKPSATTRSVSAICSRNSKRCSNGSGATRFAARPITWPCGTTIKNASKGYGRICV